MHPTAVTMEYQIFDGVLRSEVPFPELPAADGETRPRWSLTVGATAPVMPDSPVLGEEDVAEGVKVRLFRSADTARLVFDDTGTFDVMDGGTRLVWYPPPGDTDQDAVRKDILGRVMAVSLHEGGDTPLHGSAVVMPEGAVAFVAPKFYGKSTAAAALVDAGAHLLSDDLVAVGSNRVPVVKPAMSTIHLWRDAVGHVTAAASERTTPPGASKVRVRWRAPVRESTSEPLRAIYILSPVDADSPEGVQRERITGRLAPVVVLAQSKIALLLGSTGCAELLPRVCALTERVPVYRLSVPRDMERLKELTDRMFEWHAPLGARLPLGSVH